MTSFHTLELNKILRIDITEPVFLDFYTVRNYDGGSERVPVLLGNDARLNDLNLPSNLLAAGEGYTFYAFSDLQLLQLAFGGDDPDSGLRFFKYRATEAGLRQSQATGTYSRPAANNTLTIIEGKWNPDSTPKQLSPGSSQCMANTTTARNSINVVHALNCTYANQSLCTYATPVTSCFCTAFGHDDSCFQRYYIQKLQDGSSINESSAERATWRAARPYYWHMFEFEVQLNISNYALLSSSRKL